MKASITNPTVPALKAVGTGIGSGVEGSGLVIESVVRLVATTLLRWIVD